MTKEEYYFIGVIGTILAFPLVLSIVRFKELPQVKFSLAFTVLFCLFLTWETKGQIVFFTNCATKYGEICNFIIEPDMSTLNKLVRIVLLSLVLVTVFYFLKQLLS